MSLLGPNCEVTLRTDKVLEDKNFLKMSVAAEQGCHVLAVPEGPRLVSYLKEKRAEGFKVVALEQASTSVILNSGTVLPRAMVVVVGSEGAGVPPWLMQSGLVDLFVELPLMGQTRSLNAHVATAMLLWHYCQQHAVQK